ncbi:MAG TPA: FIST N-terminal domain-containing protein [Actinomycetota bacterium]|nr:FIST N-terminal domain-containing protein [Actinomycetota bacterium]
MAVGHSDDIDPDAAVDEVVRQCESALDGATPRAGLLFCSYESDAEPYLRAVRAAYPDIELAGSTSSAEMSSVLGFQEDSVALALFASDSVDMTAGCATGVEESPAAAARSAVEDAKRKTEQEPRLCIAVPSVSGDDPTVLLRELQAALGDEVPVIGGGSAPRTGAGQPRVARQFCGDRVLEDAAAVLLFSGPLTFSFGVDTGWRPLGSRGRVTAAHGNVVLEIDGEPALAFYQRYLGEGGTPTAANPLAVYEGPEDAYYLRVPFASDVERGAVILTGGIPHDAEVQLTVAVTDEIFAGAQRAVRTAFDAFPQGSPPDAALVFSCAIRKLVLGTRTGTELDIMRAELGDGVPVAGFYCFGEIAPIEGGRTRFHNETFVALLLGETRAPQALPA